MPDSFYSIKICKKTQPPPQKPLQSAVPLQLVQYYSKSMLHLWSIQQNPWDCPSILSYLEIQEFLCILSKAPFLPQESINVRAGRKEGFLSRLLLLTDTAESDKNIKGQLQGAPRCVASVRSQARCHCAKDPRRPSWLDSKQAGSSENSGSKYGSLRFLGLELGTQTHHLSQLRFLQKTA